MKTVNQSATDRLHFYIKSEVLLLLGNGLDD